MPELKLERADARDGADNAANGVRDVVVAVRRMADVVFAAARNPSLEADDLGDESIILRQGDLSRVEQRQHVPEQIGLGLLADFVADAVPAERFFHELATVVVANNLAEAAAGKY